MSLYRCSSCGCVENTATSGFLVQKGDKLCSECDPEIGKWHGKFEKRSADGYYYDARGYIYGPEEVEERVTVTNKKNKKGKKIRKVKKKMVWSYNDKFEMIGRYDEANSSKDAS